MTIHDAELSDIYVDAQGKLWRVVGVCRSPTVTVEEVEGRPSANPNYLNQAAVMQIVGATPPSLPIIKDRQTGGVDGAMWDGFKRIWRKDKA